MTRGSTNILFRALHMVFTHFLATPDMDAAAAQPPVPALFHTDLSSALDVIHSAAVPPALEPQHQAVLALGTRFFTAQCLPLNQGQRVGRKVCWKCQAGTYPQELTHGRRSPLTDAPLLRISLASSV